MNKEITEIQQIIRRQFPQLSDVRLQEEIAEVGSIQQFKEGTVLLDYGSYIKQVPLIVSGSIKVTREAATEGKELLLYFLNAGDTCSMSFTCCMMDKKSAIKTEALEPTTIIAIPISKVDEWMTKYPVWKNFVMQSYDNKMLELVKVIDSIAFQGLDERMQRYLQDLSRSTGSTIIPFTHQQIAKDLNVSREAVSRLLKKMESLGWVELTRNQTVLKPKT